MAHSKENNFKESLSLTLIVAEDSAQKMGCGWSRYAKIIFTLVNQISEILSQRIGLFFCFYIFSYLFKVEIFTSFELCLLCFFLFLTETMFDQKSSVFSSETMFSIGKFDEHFAGFIVNGEIKIVVEFLEIIDKLVLSKESNPPFKKTKLNNDGEVSKDLIREVPVIMESIVVNGFHVLPSQVNKYANFFFEISRLYCIVY